MNRLLLIIGLLFSLAITALTENVQETPPPQRVNTAIGFYDVITPDEIHKLTTSDIQKLVRAGWKGAGAVLLYCFEEKVFQYTSGKYENATINYRLRMPKNIRHGRKYPLVVHLHGAGDGGSDNLTSLIHLHSILPVLIGPESEDFFMLVTQCPPNSPGWSFNSAKDGNLDVLMAIMEHVIAEYPIDIKRITATGVSGGGWGVWELILRHPEMFAGAVPTSCSAPQSQRLASLKQVPIWSVVNKKDTYISHESNQVAMRMINKSGGSMAVSESNAAGHNALRPALEDYNCLRWMLAQRKGSWVTPPPGTIVHKPNSFLFTFAMFVVPFSFLIFLLRKAIGEQVAIIGQSLLERIGKG